MDAGHNIHQAGDLVDLVQKCSRCGKILFDYRIGNWVEVGPWIGWAVFRGSVKEDYGTTQATDHSPNCISATERAYFCDLLDAGE